MGADLNLLKENVLKSLVDKASDFNINFYQLDESIFRKRIETILRSIIREQKIALSHQEQKEVLREIASYIFGLGPIDSLLRDAEVTEIMINGPYEVYIEKNGNIERTGISFRDNEHLAYFVERIVSPLGRRVTELEPYVDARLKDGSRVNIVRSPISSMGYVVTIRKFSRRVLTIEDLIGLGTLDEYSAEFLKCCVISRLNILIVGGASSGKTTLLNVLVSFIPQTNRVITIEDTRELHLPGKHVVPLETRLPNIEGKGEITIRDLIRNSLHMRPDRIIIGEVRSDEVWDMVQAMNTGHDGSMTTLHANSAVEALDRLELLAVMGSPNISMEIAKRHITNAIDLIVHISRLNDGSRKILKICGLVKSKQLLLEDVFIFNKNENRLINAKPIENIADFCMGLKVKQSHVL